MTSVNNTVDNLVQQIKNSVDNNTISNWSENTITELFDDSYYNAGETGKKKIQEQIDNLTKYINTKKQEAEDLAAEIEKKNYDINTKSNNLGDIMIQISNCEEDYQDDLRSISGTAAAEAMLSYKYNDGRMSFYDCYIEAFNKKLSGLGSFSKLRVLIEQTGDQQSVLKNACDDIQTDLDKVNALNNDLKNANAIIRNLTLTRDNMSNTIMGYQNNDLDAKPPIYSGDKAATADEFLGLYTSRYKADLTDKVGALSDEEKNQICNSALEKYKNTDMVYAGGDQYSAQNNPELMDLRNAVNNGMIDELKAAGLSSNDIMNFVSNNWKNVGIISEPNGNGGTKWTIPQGHSTDAYCMEPAYNALTELVKDGQTNVTASSVDQNQLLEFKNAVEQGKILDRMYNEGFTFKEALNLITRIWPNAGISYDLGSQADGRNYGKVADNETSGTLFKDVGDTILKYWNVGGDAIKASGGSENDTVQRFDPITFQKDKDSVTYTFITDRDNDGKFDYEDGMSNDLLGSKEGISELLAYDYNNDGYINSKDVNEKGERALDKLTLMSNNQKESVDKAEDVDKYKMGPSYTNTVNFDVTYTSAAEAGITSIDLSKMKKQDTGKGDALGNTTKEYDNEGENFEDINGSSIINQFNITMEGQNEPIKANETLNTEENLETFYGQVADNQTGNIFSKLSNTQIKASFGNWVDDGAKATSEMLDNLAADLEDKIDDANNDKKAKDALEEVHDRLIEQYGTDGVSGDFIEAVRTSSARAADVAFGSRTDNEGDAYSKSEVRKYQNMEVDEAAVEATEDVIEDYED